MRDIARSLPLRLYHWVQAPLLVLVSLVWNDGHALHQRIGYALAALLLARLLWGLAGAAPDRLAGYLRAARRPGGNRQRSALALLLMLLACAVSGHLQTTDRFWGEAWMMSLHAGASTLLGFMALLHAGRQLWLARDWRRAPLRRMLGGGRPR